MEDKQIFNKWEEFKSLLRSTKREGIENIITWLDESDFKFAPASTKYHNAFRGGLLSHSLNVYYHMYDLSNLLQFFGLNEDTIILTSLLHDVCKVEFYETSTRNTKDTTGNWIQVPYYTVKEVRAWGHAQKSVIELQKHGLKLNDVEITMILNHMGFSETESTQRVSISFGQCPQSLVLYYADMMATYLTESCNLPERFKSKLVGRNINECIQELAKPKTIKYNGTEYQIAPAGVEVDGNKVIPLILEDGTAVNVYAPHGDGLPF